MKGRDAGPTPRRLLRPTNIFKKSLLMAASDGMTNTVSSVWKTLSFHPPGDGAPARAKERGGRRRVLAGRVRLPRQGPGGGGHGA